MALVDMERMVVVAGQEEDETSLLVKDTDGNIIKGVPVYSAHCNCALQLCRVYCGIILHR